YQVVDLLTSDSAPRVGYWMYCFRDDVVLLYQTPGEVSQAMPGPGAGLPPEAETTVFVKAAEGATIAVGGATVEIPPGALAGDGDVTVGVYEQARTVPYNQEFTPLGSSVEVALDTEVVGPIDVTFPDQVAAAL